MDAGISSVEAVSGSILQPSSAKGTSQSRALLAPPTRIHGTPEVRNPYVPRSYPVPYQDNAILEISSFLAQQLGITETQVWPT